MSTEHEVNLNPFMYSYNILKDNIKNQPIDYLQLHEIQMKIGKLGEAFVYEIECEKLKGTKFELEIDNKKALDPKNGYDILSFTIEGEPIHIEVKATTGTEETFYLSKNEFRTAEEMKKKGKVYVIYFVRDIMSDNPNLNIIKDITNNEEYSFEEMNWKVSKIL
ncbi:DUF3883 domain-containing protein [Aquisalibacillus elongatus]|uniref:DUF3883 domain-containing protein n=1 Tax=Aquisalibacillus elongatus TaxID=485577 RepID=UPI000F51DD55|nr:DUF3883 domain-containing protein [Aquisalibacillus elongatus]